MKSKIIYTGAILLMCCFVKINEAQAAAKLQFCLSVTKDGEADRSFNAISFNSGKLVKCLIKLDTPLINQRYVVYYLYKEDENKTWELTNVYRYDIQPNWNWFYYNLFFSKAGKYKLVVEDEFEIKLAESTLTLTPD